MHPSYSTVPPRTDREYVESGLPPDRCAVTFTHSNTGRYAQSHITDNRVQTLCGLFVPVACWMRGPRGELPYVNNPVTCQVCISNAGIDRHLVSDANGLSIRY